MKRIGIAIGPAELGHLPDILRDVRTQHRRVNIGLVVALLPPLVRVRHVELPPLRYGDLRRVLTRDIEQYFSGIQTPQVIAAKRTPPTGYIVAAADAPLISSVLEEAAQAGWRRCSTVPAYATWEYAGRAVTRDGVLLLEREYAVEALQFRRGRLVLVRRLRPSMPADRVHTALGGDTAARLDEPDIVAAQGAPRVRGFELVPDEVRAERIRSDRRWAARLLGGAAAVLILAAGIELWGRQRELAVLRAERAALARQVAQAIQIREAIEGLDRRVAALGRAQSVPIRWSAALATIAEHLPAEAHLVSFRGSGDSIVLDGMASRATTAFEAFQRVSGIAGVHANAPIRQEARDSQPPVERFTLSARLTAP